MYNKMNNLYFFVFLIIFYKKFLYYFKYMIDLFIVICEIDVVSSFILKIIWIVIKV